MSQPQAHSMLGSQVEQTDINNASRPIKTSEMAACKAAGIQYLELPVAFDALTIAVHADNSWAQDMTIEELRRIWEPGAEGAITRWNHIRPCGCCEEGASRTDYTASEDDAVLVAGVSTDPDALGYFGLGYYAENWEILQLVAIDSGQGPVQPTVEAVKTASYKPLSRPLFLYVNAEAVETKPELRAFVEYYLQDVPGWVPFVGYIPLSEDVYTLTLQRFHERKLGTGYGGTFQPDLALEEMLKKDAGS